MGYTSTYDKLNDEKWLLRQVKKLGKTDREIAEDVGCGEDTVRRARTEHNIGNQRTYDKLKNEEWLRKKYIDEYKSQRQIAEIVGCSQTGVQRALDKYEISDKQNYGDLPTVDQKFYQILDGEMLGDGHISKEGDITRSARYMQTAKRLCHLKYLRSFFEDYEIGCTIHSHTTNGFKLYNLQTESSPVFGKYRNEWYVGRKKILPSRVDLSPLTLRHWYIGDGTFSDRSICLSVHTLKKYIPILRSKLLDHGISTTENSNGINIRMNSEDEFFRHMADLPRQLKEFEYKWIEGVEPP